VVVHWIIRAALGDDGPAPASAWAVTVGRYADKPAALAAADRYLQAGLPAHGDWPHAVQASDLGFPDGEPWVLVVAIAADVGVAERLDAHLVRRGAKSEVAATTARPDDLRLLAMDAFTISGNGAPLFAYDVCLAESIPVGCLGHARPSGEDLRLVIPFPAQRAGTELILIADAGEPWTCPPVDLGPVNAEAKVWLRGRSQGSCFEQSKPRRRRRE
jgi:hypothetical protein